MFSTVSRQLSPLQAVSPTPYMSTNRPRTFRLPLRSFEVPQQPVEGFCGAPPSAILDTAAHASRQRSHASDLWCVESLQ
jgi:hypothetical protein